MDRAPTALHRVAAWCVAGLFIALVLVGTRSVLRALQPKPEPELSTIERVGPTLDDVDVEVGTAAPQHAATAEAEPPVVPPRNSRRAVWAPGDEPMEKRPTWVIEGTVRSVSGLLQQPVELQVEHPSGGMAPTRLFFDRTAPDGHGRVAPFKLVKPAPGAYVLRPVVLGRFDYEVAPRERRIEGSTGGVDFVVRDDVPHVDLDVVALGSDGEELPTATLLWRVHRGEDLGIEDLLRGLDDETLEPERGPELRHVPTTNPLECLVTADGHRPHREVTHLFAGQQRLEVPMEPGWGIYLVDMGMRTRRPQEERPFLGEIFVDGRRIGFTDPSGVTYVEADATPREFAVLFGGRYAKLLRKVPKDQLVVTIDHTLLEAEDFVPRPARD